MKKLLLIALLVAAPVGAQDRTAVALAKADLEARGVDLSGACGAVKIANLVAWRLGGRFGLLHKAGGNRAILKADGSCLTGEQSNDPEGYATDYLIDRATGFGYDVLSDGGGANGPQWAGPENAPDMVARNWSNYREAVDPTVYVTGPVTPPVVLPPTPPVVPPTLPAVQVCDLSGVLAKLDDVKQAVDDGRGEQQDNTKAVRQDIADFREAARSKLAGAMTFAAKYILPAVAGVFGGMRLK
jgi:hypothetical protein